MAVKTNAQLRLLFENGDTPTASDFGDLIDTVTMGTSAVAELANSPNGWAEQSGPYATFTLDAGSGQTEILDLTTECAVTAGLEYSSSAAGISDNQLELSFRDQSDTPLANSTLRLRAAQLQYMCGSLTRILPAGTYRVRVQNTSSTAAVAYVGAFSVSAIRTNAT